MVCKNSSYVIFGLLFIIFSILSCAGPEGKKFKIAVATFLRCRGDRRHLVYDKHYRQDPGATLEGRVFRETGACEASHFNGLGGKLSFQTRWNQWLSEMPLSTGYLQIG